MRDLAWVRIRVRLGSEIGLELGGQFWVRNSKSMHVRTYIRPIHARYSEGPLKRGAAKAKGRYSEGPL